MKASKKFGNQSEGAIIGNPQPCSPRFIKQVRNLQKNIRSLFPSILSILERVLSGEGIDEPTFEIEVYQSLPHFLHALGNSAQTICDLSDAPGFHTRDCMCLARSVTELAINICYLIAYPRALDKAWRHARQLAVSRRKRESKIANHNLRLHKPLPRSWAALKDIPQLTREFTSKKGRTLNWTEYSTEQRLAFIEKSSTLVFSYLHAAHFLSYIEGSEMLHGSLYGVLRFIGLLEPEEPQRTELRLGNHIARLHIGSLISVFFSLLAVIMMIEMRYGVFEKEMKHAFTIFRNATKQQSKKGGKHRKTKSFAG